MSAIPYQVHRAFNLRPCRADNVEKAYHSIRVTLRIEREVLHMADVVTRDDIHTTTIAKILAERIRCDISSPYRSEARSLRVFRLNYDFPQNAVRRIELFPKTSFLPVFDVMRINKGHG